MNSMFNFARLTFRRFQNLSFGHRLLSLSWLTRHQTEQSINHVSFLLDCDHFWKDKKYTHNTKSKLSNKGNMATIKKLRFDNLVLRTLPIDEETENFTRKVSGACFSRIVPTPVDKPELVVFSGSALNLLDLSDKDILDPEFAEYFSGNKILPGSETASHCYCGHQFGYFSGQLGDGAAIYLGEVINHAGKRWEIQIKGAGKTPYSRQADGRKVLRSSIREFLCSEAMHHLGIPTTRAGCCITSDSKVIRDIFYTGNAIEEKCSIVLRIAETFIRFGSFEIFKPTDMETGRQGPSVGRNDILELMLQYVVKTFYTHIWEKHVDDKAAAYVEFYREIVERTAKLVAEWQRVGFCHGVLNTDNMSITGLTIDYGPYGFMDKFDPGFICNSSDDGGRYSYEKQPEMCKWNCLKLAEALSPIVPMEKMQEILDTYDEVFEQQYIEKMGQKFGLTKTSKPEDKEFFQSFLDTLQETGADFTNSFRCLSQLPLPSNPEFKDKLSEVRDYLVSQCCTLNELIESCKPRMDPRQLNTFIMLMQMNPELLAQLGAGHRSISQELERIEKTKALTDATPEEKNSKDKTLWVNWLEKYTERLNEEEGVNEDIEKLNSERVKVMNSSNPRFVLRNYIAQAAIEKAEAGDYMEVQRVLKLLEQPYSDTVDLDGLQGAVANMNVSAQNKDNVEPTSTSAPEVSKSELNSVSSHVVKNYDDKPPSWAGDLKVS